MGAPAPAPRRSGRRLRLRVRGTVQGVGFRPFAYGLASRLSLSGFVRNDGEGVLIEVEGPSAEAFVAELENGAAAARPYRLDRGRRHRPPGRRRLCDRRHPAGPVRHAHRRGRRDLRGLPRRAVRPGEPLLRLPADQLHPLRAALHADEGPALRPGADLDGVLPDVPGLRARLRRPGEPAFPRRADRLPALRAEARPAGRRGRGSLAGRPDRRPEGTRRLPPSVRRVRRERGGDPAPAQGARREAVRRDGREPRLRRADRRDRAGRARSAHASIAADRAGAKPGAPRPERRSPSPRRRPHARLYAAALAGPARARRVAGLPLVARFSRRTWRWSRPAPTWAASRWWRPTRTRSGDSPASPT